MSDLSKHVLFDDDAVASIIGEGLHTGLRKGTDAPESTALYNAISASDEAWSDALRFLVKGLRFMGVTVSKEPDPVVGRDLDKECEVCGLGDLKFDDRGEALGPVRYFEWPHHAHLGCGVAQGWGPR